MTGILNALVGNGGSIQLTLTVGNSGTSYGFVLGTYGSVSVASYNSAAIRNIVSETGGGIAYDLQIVLAGLLSQSFFSSVKVQTTSGTFRTFRTADATTYTQLPGSPDVTLWQWDSNTPAFTNTGTRVVQFF
jgi:hypothetical protein